MAVWLCMASGVSRAEGSTRARLVSSDPVSVNGVQGGWLLYIHFNSAPSLSLSLCPDSDLSLTARRAFFARRVSRSRPDLNTNLTACLKVLV